jgi:hypothetical protein
VLGQATDDTTRLGRAFELAVSRAPDPEDTAVLLQLLRSARKKFTADGPAAEKLLAIGHSPRNASIPAAELAAWTTVASVILNLDETISKP